MDKDEIPTCEILEVIPAPDGTEAVETITKCEGVIKPGIVMFGEALPEVCLLSELSNTGFSQVRTFRFRALHLSELNV